jgi:hypothetical protein
MILGKISGNKNVLETNWLGKLEYTELSRALVLRLPSPWDVLMVSQSPKQRQLWVLNVPDH